jgi:hypothetical protein
MSSNIVQSTSCILSHSDFITEITNSKSEDDCFIGKRKPLSSCELDCQSRSKLLVLKQQNNKAADFENTVLSQEKTDSEASSEADSFSGPTSQYSNFFKDQTTCYKMLLKHFLIEILMNEQLNLQRFNYLPRPCQDLVLIFLKRNFGFDMDEELKKGTMHKHTFALKGKSYITAKQSSVALPFLTDCYVFGVVKQLQKTGKLVRKECAIKMLHSKLVQSGVPVQEEDFFSSIESLLRYEGEEISDPSKEISDTLIAKMINIPELTLAKYYSHRIQIIISDLFEGSTSVEQLKESFEQSNLRIDIYSAYLGKKTFKKANYRNTLLTLV